MPDPNELHVPFHVVAREQLSPTVVRLQLMPESELSWRAGQFITLAHPSGAQRSYSLASVYELGELPELHVRRHEGGLVSGWLCDEVAVGDVLSARGPSGACFYEFSAELAERELLLIAGGTGLAPLWAIARDALHSGHRGPITLFHGSRHVDGIYMYPALTQLAREHGNFRCEAWVDEAEGPLPAGIELGRVVDAAFGLGQGQGQGQGQADRAGTIVYLAGPPAMVHAARYWTVLCGVARGDTHADPFDSAEPFMPDDKGTIEAFAPEPELWAALDHGPGLSAILEDFYDLAFEDPRLSPFFHSVTKKRAREKQYEFLSDLFTGVRHYFGARPFNAHHWMVISDELFDYREELVEAVLRRHGLAEHLIRRWLAAHELFRRVIVKPQRRGLVFDGVEHLEEGHRDELLEVGCLCDGCSAALEVGQLARYQPLTGKLFCRTCSATSAA